jgi:hypothetical protein
MGDAWQSRWRVNLYDRSNWIEYVPGKGYTQAQLEQLADQLLFDDRQAKGILDQYPYLNEVQLRERRSREIFNENGVPEPELVSGIYHRAHPQGRTLREDKKPGESFFK